MLFGIWRHLSRERKIQLELLMVMFLSSAAEVVSLGAVIPFLAIFQIQINYPIGQLLITHVFFIFW